jgi:hypothetical protein
MCDSCVQDSELQLTSMFVSGFPIFMYPWVPNLNALVYANDSNTSLQ